MKFLGSRPQHEDLKLLVEDSDAVENNLAKFDSSGNPVDSGICADDIANKEYVDGIPKYDQQARAMALWGL